MTLWPAFRDLAVETVTAPRMAAARILKFQPGRDWLWQALLCAVVLNALVFGLSTMIAPPGTELPPMMATPFLFALTMACGLVITIFGVFWVGAWLGGQARLDDILVLMTWLQVLRFAVQVVAVPLGIIAPALTVMGLMVASVLGVWILVNFLDVAHRFDNLFKAFGVLIFTGMGIAMGLILMLSIIGVSTAGFAADV